MADIMAAIAAAMVAIDCQSDESSDGMIEFRYKPQGTYWHMWRHGVAETDRSDSR